MGHILELSFLSTLAYNVVRQNKSRSFKHISIFEIQIISLESNVKFNIFILLVV